MRLGIFQLDTSFSKLETNMEYVENVIARSDADIYLCPELFNTGYELDKVKKRADNAPAVKKWASETALKNGCVFIPGSLGTNIGAGVGNVMSVFGTQGEDLAAYGNTHLFTLTGEDDYFISGDGPVLFEAAGLNIGMAVCYDLRFPEFFIKYREAGAHGVMLAANWPAARIGHWLTLGKARAVENVFFTAGANRVGEEAGLLFGGSSFCFGPDGGELLVMDDKAGFETVDIDTEAIVSLRARFDSFDDRRTDIY